MIIWCSITSAELRFNYKHTRGFGTVLFTLYLKVRCYRDRYVLCTAVHCCKNALNPPIYLHLIFAILQFEISSLMNLIFSLF